MVVDNLLEELRVYIMAGLLEVSSGPVSNGEDITFFKLTDEGRILYFYTKDGFIHEGEIDNIQIGEDTSVSRLASYCGDIIKLQDKGLITVFDHRYVLNDISKRYLEFMDNAEIEHVTNARKPFWRLKNIRLNGEVYG